MWSGSKNGKFTVKSAYYIAINKLSRLVATGRGFGRRGDDNACTSCLGCLGKNRGFGVSCFAFIVWNLWKAVCFESDPTLIVNRSVHQTNEFNRPKVEEKKKRES